MNQECSFSFQNSPFESLWNNQEKFRNFLVLKHVETTKFKLAQHGEITGWNMYKHGEIRQSYKRFTLL